MAIDFHPDAPAGLQAVIGSRGTLIGYRRARADLDTFAVAYYHGTPPGRRWSVATIDLTTGELSAAVARGDWHRVCEVRRVGDALDLRQDTILAQRAREARCEPCPQPDHATIVKRYADRALREDRR